MANINYCLLCARHATTSQMKKLRLKEVQWLAQDNTASKDLTQAASHDCLQSVNQEHTTRDLPGGAVVKNPPANAGDMGSSPGTGRSHMPRSN